MKSPEEMIEGEIRTRLFSINRPLVTSLRLARYLIIIAGVATVLAGIGEKPIPTPINYADVNSACNLLELSEDPLTRFGVHIETRGIKAPTPYSGELINSNLYVIYRDGQQRFLTNNPQFDEGYASLSPDGSKIVFSRRGGKVYVDREMNLIDFEHTGSEGLYTINLDGSNEQRITNLAEGEYDQNPSWSADGKWIVFSRDSGSQKNRQSDLYVVGVNGDNLRRVTNFSGINSPIFSPIFSPDGKNIAFQDSNGTYVISVNGKSFRNLSDRSLVEDSYQSLDDYVSWVSNRQIIVNRQFRFPRGAYGNKRYLINADGSGSVDITEDCPPTNPIPAISANRT